MGVRMYTNRMKNKDVTIAIQNLTFNGLGRGFLDSGEEVHVLGAFPGETVVVHVFGKQMKALQGVVKEVVIPSEFRIEPKEAHAIHTSPWQALDYTQENVYKRDIVKGMWKEIVGVDLDDLDIVYTNQSYGYRNSVEFNVIGEAGNISLALLKRGRKELFSVTGSALAGDAVNTAAQKVIGELNSHKVPAESIKQLVVRSNRLGECLIGLYVTNKNFMQQFPQLTFLTDSVKGAKVYYSRPEVNRNETTELLLSQGTATIQEYILGKLLTFGLTDFFQLNVPVFEKAVKRIKEYVEGESIVDFYSGVGAIGIGVSDVIKDGILVESSEAATAQAQKNSEANNLTNIRAFAGTAEELREYITHDKVVTVDPPRSGLEPQVVQRILAEKPKRLIYLSCKPYTQAQDIKEMLSDYSVVFMESYNFFPRTPHIENLCILERK